jgi:Bacterial transglutaminase-like cysteine proteinase BTLCP/Outer membrane efflux protein
MHGDLPKYALPNSTRQVLASQDRIRVAQNNIASAERILDAIKERFKAGTSTDLDVAQQESVLANQRALVPPLRQTLDQNLNARMVSLAVTFVILGGLGYIGWIAFQQKPNGNRGPGARLAGAGAAAREVVTRAGEHHLVLVVRTSSGDLVLDNLTPRIRPWSRAPYRWVRMQMPDNPRCWAIVAGRGA